MQGEKLATPSRDVVLLLTGYYNGKRNNTVVEPQPIKKHEEEVDSYCDKRGQTNCHGCRQERARLWQMNLYDPRSTTKTRYQREYIQRRLAATIPGAGGCHGRLAHLARRVNPECRRNCCKPVRY